MYVYVQGAMCKVQSAMCNVQCVEMNSIWFRLLLLLLLLLPLLLLLLLLLLFTGYRLCSDPPDFALHGLASCMCCVVASCCDALR